MHTYIDKGTALRGGETEAQDELVMEYQRKLSAGIIDITQQEKIQKLFQNVQRILYPISVRNPYAETLIIPREVFKQEEYELLMTIREAMTFDEEE